MALDVNVGCRRLLHWVEALNAAFALQVLILQIDQAVVLVPELGVFQ